MAATETPKVNIPQIALHNCYGSSDKRTNQDKIDEFLKNDLTTECMREQVQEGDILYAFISSRLLGADFYFEKSKISSRILNAVSNNHVKRYCPNRVKVYTAGNYILSEEKHRWHATPILGKDEWLERDKVRGAFFKIGRAKGWRKISSTRLCRCTLDGKEVYAWFSACMDREATLHRMFCLVNNGLILIDHFETIKRVSCCDRLYKKYTKIEVADAIFYSQYDATENICSLATVEPR